MKTSGFRKQTAQEIKEKQDKTTARRIASLKAKQSKAKKLPPKPKKPAKVAKQAKKAKPKTQAWLKKELDRVFSIYIRQKYDKSCYTCGKVGTLQNGHFISRQYIATRWDENNCRPQCVGCNIFGNGKPLDFEERLKKDLGCEFVEVMKKKRHLSMKLDRNWYREQIDIYKELIA